MDKIKGQLRAEEDGKATAEMENKAKRAELDAIQNALDVSPRCHRHPHYHHHFHFHYPHHGHNHHCLRHRRDHPRHNHQQYYQHKL